MISYPSPRQWGRLCGALALGSALACGILDVTDPDIINPEVLQTPEGAEALRVGTLRQLNVATAGVETEEPSSAFNESMFMLSGLMADEFRSGDTFIQRDETDRRDVQTQNANVDDAYRALHRARINAQQAAATLETYAPDDPVWKIAEMQFVQGYTETLLGEYFCGAVPFSDIAGSQIVDGDPLATSAIFERAVAHFDDALATLTGETGADADRIRDAAQVGRGRALLDLGRYTEAAAAVAGVATSYAYLMESTETPINNTIWEYNNNERRFTMGNGDGTNGLDYYAAADPRLPRCTGGDAACRRVGVTNTRVFDSSVGAALPFYVQLIWDDKADDLAIVDGVEARLIEAEAQLHAGDATTAFGTLNTLRGGVPGLLPLVPAATADGQVDQLFRERAFWLFGRGHRLGDLRRLTRPVASGGYGRPIESVYPTGPYIKGGSFGGQVNFPVPQSEENNPRFARDACVVTTP